MAQDVTAQDLVDAILAGTCDSTLDLNGDTVCDVADIVCLSNDCHRPANFQVLEQTVSETDGVVNVTVEFPVPVTTTVNISIDPAGTATSGGDFTPPAPSWGVAGASSVVIPVSIQNDGEVGEPIESFTLIIEPGSGYQVGARNRHTVFIDDDDALWHGILETETGLGRVPLSVELSEDGGGMAAKIISDGLGSFPIGAYDATSVALVLSVVAGQSSFDADVTAIPMAASATDLGVSFTRAFSFHSDDSRTCDDLSTPCTSDGDCGGVCLPTENIVSPTFLRGTFTETVVFSTAPNLNRTVSGWFTLTKTVPPGPVNGPLSAP